MSENDDRWTVLHARSLIRDRWIDLRADACETASGRRIDPYYVLTYPDWVVVVAITPERHMVLVRQYRHGVGASLLEAPAGGMEAGDSDPETAARRELLEETGYASDRMEHLSSLYANPATQTNRIHAFLARDAVCVRAQDLDPGEDGLTVALLPVETVLAGLRTGLIGQSMHVAAILQAMTVLSEPGEVPESAATPPLPALAGPSEGEGGPPTGDAITVYGIDFTSAPTRRKPLTCVECRLDGADLQFTALHLWSDFSAFSAFLSAPGPWIAGLDFPFGQSRRFIETIGWPQDWKGYVGHVAGLSRSAFVTALTDYRTPRADGDKEHRREVDKRTGAISPQKLYGIPVGLMFYEGAKRLLASDVDIPLLRPGDPSRTVVEAYPGVMVRTLIGRRSYKNDDRARQTADQHAARREILAKLLANDAAAAHGLRITAPLTLADDPGADTLDALICAVQAAWAYRQRYDGYGIPADADALEGWICSPGVVAPTPGDPGSGTS